jgi:hypothetical protein
VQRALLWLLSDDAGLRAERPDLVADAVVALEDWIHGGAA